MSSPENVRKTLEVLTEEQIIAMVIWLTGGAASPSIVASFIALAREK